MIAATQPALFAPVVNVAPVVVDVAAELLELAALDELPTPGMSDAQMKRWQELRDRYRFAIGDRRLHTVMRLGELAKA